LDFREELPDGCPPEAAHDGGCGTAYRLVPTAKPVPSDFASNAAKKETCPETCDPCRWASCSLFTDLNTIQKKRKTFKKLRKFHFAAEMTIKSGSGLLMQEGSHIDFWMFASFDPIGAIADVKALPDA
jgi:hypothetical protein